MSNAARVVGRFFAIALLQAFVGSQNGQCQQGVDLLFTNRVATFTNLQGETFIGAELIEADATQIVFKTNDIFGAVKFTNLSTTTLELLGIPLSQLGLAHDLEVQKAKAIANQQAILREEQDQLLNSSNLVALAIQSVTRRARARRGRSVAWSQSENSEGFCFWAEGWMARRDEGEYPWRIFD